MWLKKRVSAEDIDDMRLRREVLADEQQTLLDELREFDDRINDEEQQMKNIETQQLRVQQQIDDLTATYLSLFSVCLSTTPEICLCSTMWNAEVVFVYSL